MTALARRSDGDGEIVYETDYLIGADGAGSGVRTALGIDLMGESGVIRPMMGGPMYATYFEADPEAGWFAQDPAWQYWILNPEIRALVHFPSTGRTSSCSSRRSAPGTAGCATPSG